jgi:hypothetical protein
MKNIFKTTLKKDIISDITDNNIREVRFPITKFWATRLTDKYDIDKKEFEFKTFHTLEFSSPSNKDTDAMIYVFGFSKTYVDNDEFVVCFCDITDEVNDVQETNDIEQIEFIQTEICDSQFSEDNVDFIETVIENLDLTPNDDFYTHDGSDVWGTDVYFSTNNDEVVVYNEFNEEFDIDIDECYNDIEDYMPNEEVLAFIKKLFDDENILKDFYEDENVFATNARQVIVLPNGKVLGFKKSLPVNNDVEVRIEFDNNKKIYFDEFQNSDSFKEYVLKTLSEIRKNNFVFVWKIYTGIFIDNNDRVYFGIKYSTRKSIGFNRKHNVQ